jgi:glycerol-3-phosphate dehydrogenase
MTRLASWSRGGGISSLADARAFDVVVIGGGVLGTAVAARLAMTTASVCLLEAADDVAEGASKGNAGIATSFYAPPGTLEADLIAGSWPRWEDICDRLDVPFSRPGALTVAINDDQVPTLAGIYDEAIAAGTRAELLTGEQARDLEPMLTPECRGAVHLPDEGLIDPVRLTCGYAELAAANGASVRLSCPAIGFDTHAGQLTTVQTPAGWIRARWVINAAGLGSGTISALAGGEELRIWPRKGQYWVLDRAFGSRLRKMVLPVPMPHTRGVQVVPTTNGSALLGPDAQDIADPADKATDPDSLQALLRLTEQLVPEVSRDLAIKTYAANRAAAEETVRVRPDGVRPNLIHVGNRSTGVSSSPGTAERVLGLLRDAGLDCEDRPERVDALPKVRRLLRDPDPESLPDADPRYRQVVCVCEQVTAAEIAAAFDRHVPPRSIEGIRKRTQATGGRCQGSVCMVGVAFLCSLHTGLPPAAIRQGPSGATLGVGSEH